MKFESLGMRRIIGLVIAVVSLAYLVAGIFLLGPTLINDEYAALDYIYRVILQGHFFPTPDRVHKPLSMVVGLTGYLFETPLAFEVIIALFGAVFAYFLFRFVSENLGAAAGILSFLLIFTNPDILNYTVTGSTVVALAALAFIAGRASMRLEEKPSLIWLYAFCFFLGGLWRPECWLFAAPLLLYFWPLRKRIRWWRFIAAVVIIELAPVIWFGKDWFINDDLLHGIHVAVHDKTVGAGAPFTIWGAFRLFPVRISAKLSWPTALLGLFGAALFLRDRGWRGLLHPLIMFPVLVIPYVWLIVWMGVYPVQRYYFFTSLFLLIFAASAWIWLFRFFRNSRSALRWLALVAMLAFACAHLVYLPIKFNKDLEGLTREAPIQKEMTQVAQYLMEEIAYGDAPLIMIPSRRNEQLAWLFRHRETPRVVTFRKAHYLEYFKGYDFLNLEPDWIVHIDRDYQYWGPQERFKWLNFQDHTTLRGVKIDLVFTTPEIRVFKIKYPSEWPEPPPEPRIP
jgi:hypothetical protein